MTAFNKIKSLLPLQDQAQYFEKSNDTAFTC